MEKRILATGYIRAPYKTIHMTVAPATPEEVRMRNEVIRGAEAPALDDDDRRKLALESGEDI